MEIFEFLDLKMTVEKNFGISVDAYVSQFVLPPKEERRFKIHDLDGKIELTDDGIFYNAENGKKVKGFIYIEDGYPIDWVRRKGMNSKVPKFHILKCETIEQQIARGRYDNYYIFENKPTLMVDIDGTEKHILLCRNCISSHSEISRKINTEEFVSEYISEESFYSDFTESELPKAYGIELRSYTPGWEDTSKQYRVEQNFTCEKCKVKLNTDYWDGFFLETHHKNLDKSDNRKENLMCLCTLCHANIDRGHKDNYKKKTNKEKLDNFIETYYDRLKKVKNPYL